LSPDSSRSGNLSLLHSVFLESKDRRSQFRQAPVQRGGETQMSERLTLPVLPLRDFVLFPGVTTPINAGKPMTLRAIEAALANPDRLVFAVSQREELQTDQHATPESLYTIGTVARIGQLQRNLAGVQLLLHGE